MSLLNSREEQEKYPSPWCSLLCPNVAPIRVDCGDSLPSQSLASAPPFTPTTTSLAQLWPWLLVQSHGSSYALQFQSLKSFLHIILEYTFLKYVVDPYHAVQNPLKISQQHKNEVKILPYSSLPISPCLLPRNTPLWPIRFTNLIHIFSPITILTLFLEPRIPSSMPHFSSC